MSPTRLLNSQLVKHDNLDVPLHTVLHKRLIGDNSTSNDIATRNIRKKARNNLSKVSGVQRTSRDKVPVKCQGHFPCIDVSIFSIPVDCWLCVLAFASGKEMIVLSTMTCKQLRLALHEPFPKPLYLVFNPTCEKGPTCYTTTIPQEAIRLNKQVVALPIHDHLNLAAALSLFREYSSQQFETNVFEGALFQLPQRGAYPFNVLYGTRSLSEAIIKVNQELLLTVLDRKSVPGTARTWLRSELKNSSSKKFFKRLDSLPWTHLLAAHHTSCEVTGEVLETGTGIATIQQFNRLYCATQMGSPFACFALAYQFMTAGFESTYRIKPNFNRAVRLMFRSALLGLPVAKYNLACCAGFPNNQPTECNEPLTPDTELAYLLFSEAAIDMVPEAQVNMGTLHFGVLFESSEWPVFEDTARYWWAQAAFHSQKKAMLNLGSEYYCGTGVAQCPKKAQYWWRKACMFQDVHAMLLLGLSLVEEVESELHLKAWNDGLENKVLEAVFWIHQAAHQRENPDVAIRALPQLRLLGTKYRDRIARCSELLNV